ncbi:hypothetical protein BRYFOR_07251 [Marvinbryantia formatexigens DSM 14469]|uniref:Uncharacterized protein n=1 Tax=Marvinbryantia formatexigens DSM 14469 TaxID=478749 RepID=C6LF49_9FIRM|nr:hypothetical protein BRYFOR_07251 [Marvinbryantia formatexigens DSM 14469]
MGSPIFPERGFAAALRDFFHMNLTRILHFCDNGLYIYLLIYTCRAGKKPW